PAPGRVELPADRVWGAVAAVIATLAATARDAGSAVRAIAASGSGDEVAMVDGAGVAVGPVIVALDGRSGAIGRALEDRFGVAELYARTGIALTELSPLARLLWLREHEPATAARVLQLLAWPELMALRLGVEPRSEPSLAGRTLGYGLRADRYDADLLAALGIDPTLLPPVVPSGTPVGTVGAAVAERLGLDGGVVVVTGGFDQAMATLGAGALDTGTAHVGTGSYEALTAVMDQPVVDAGSRAGGWSVGRSVAGTARWSTMASWLGGAAVRWLAKGTADAWPAGPSLSPARLLWEMPAGPARLLALSGLEGAAGVLVGMELGTRRGDMAAAILEAVTMDLRRALDELERAGIRVRTLRATGGGARSRRWLQLKADVTGQVVERVVEREAGAFAAALLAGAAVGMLPPAEDAARQLVRVDVHVEPRRALEAHYHERAALHAQLRAAFPAELRAALPIAHDPEESA
ncbi:MAG: hypothetical protein LH650_02640, partial [Chloroflexi bacterium]|nr:hypothetical protein [Chloroflexota bacterium]